MRRDKETKINKMEYFIFASLSEVCTVTLKLNICNIKTYRGAFSS